MVLLMELRRHISAIAPGGMVHLITHDPAAPLDLAAWCHLTGHTYLGPVPGDQPTYAVRVEADTLATEPRSPWHRR
ncbi:sulfurtransferase TusA family protein [Nonomuraea dietziae]|uniref:sulfurtransferase TusA family protein n=1 Tax=Nonomuraea dietziae TaxID=65515 RepID=UPI00341FEA65